MMPSLLNIGPLNISAYGFFLGLAIIFGAFVFWKNTRDQGYDDETIFDNLIIVIGSSLLGARLLYVFTHWEKFAPNWLRIFLLWSVTGIWVWGAIIIGILFFILYTKKQKIPILQIFDDYGFALPIVTLLTTIGIFLDGSMVGKITKMPWGMMYPGYEEKRHPVILYLLIIALICSILFPWFKKKWLTGIQKGFWGFLSFGVLGISLGLVGIFRNEVVMMGKIPLDIILGFTFGIVCLGIALFSTNAKNFINDTIDNVISKIQ